MADHLGSYNTATSRTVVRFSFTTHAQTGAAVAPSSAFENADLRIYKDGSATQRSSAVGITMTSPFDSVTGLHHVDIDLTDNTDAGFYAAGSFYEVHLVPDETVDSLAVVRVLAYFEIGPPPVNVTQLGGGIQSLADLKDFADDGYDPATNKVQGVVLVDTTTNLTNLPTIPANWLTAAGTAADFTTEIQAGLATAAALATVDGIVDDILVDTAEIGAAGAGLTNINLPNQTMDIVGNITGNLSGSVGSVTGAVGSVTGAVGSVTGLTASNLDATISSRMAMYAQPTGFLAATFPSDPADQSLIVAATDALATLIGDVPTNAELATALGTADDAVLAQVALVKAKTDLIPASPASTTNITAASGVVLAPTGVDMILVESGITAGAGLTNDTGAQLTGINLRQALSLKAAGLTGVLAGAGTTNVTIKPTGKPAGNTRINATVTLTGNRTALTLKVPD
jgi:hypothetical protein